MPSQSLAARLAVLIGLTRSLAVLAHAQRCYYAREELVDVTARLEALAARVAADGRRPSSAARRGAGEAGPDAA